QPYSVIKIEKTSAKEKLAKLCGQGYMAKAPLHLIFCIDFHRLKRWAALEKAPFSADSGFRNFWIAFQDAIICAQNMGTAADSLGLGSVYIGPIFDNIKTVRKMFRLPKGVIPVVSLVIGYPSVKPPIRKRLGKKIVVHNEIYRNIPDGELLNPFDEKYKNAKTEINAKNLKTITKACKSVHGDKFASKCLAEIKAKKYINRAQLYFGLHYRADKMLFSNPKFLKMLKEAGLGCFTQTKK
nr:nitroreductase family protein [Spirochaetales bacterium]